MKYTRKHWILLIVLAMNAILLDYDIAKGYCEYILTLHSDPENDGTITALDVKRVFDKVLRVWLLDMTHSTDIWLLYLQFELEEYSNAKDEEQKYVRLSEFMWLERRKNAIFAHFTDRSLASLRLSIFTRRGMIIKRGRRTSRCWQR